MECHRCRSQNEAHRRFCGECGQALVTVCVRCGFLNRAVDRYCGGCGDALPAAAPTVAADLHRAAPVPEPKPASRPTAARHGQPAPAHPPPPLKPALAAAAPPVRATAESPELSEAELQELLTPPPPPAPTLPPKVSQGDIDKLFGD